MSSYQLPPISQEQNEILSLIKTSNLIIDSVAGSGKTTTNLYIAKTFPSMNILLLTYNAKLRLETKKRAQILQLSNLSVHTYHSFCVKYFRSSCQNDFEMRKLLNERKNFSLSLNFDLIVLDESQDIVPLYYQLIVFLLKELKTSELTKVCLLGDKYQCIYKYNGADERYMLFADQLFRIESLEKQIPWTQTKLSQSFRMTKKIATFINRCMLHEDRISASKEGPHVKYLLCNSFCRASDASRPDTAAFQILEQLSNGYNCDDIFVLASSIKSERCPCRTLANVLTELKIPIYVPNLEDEKLDEIVLKNKIVFSTFHQAKGLERKVVIVYGFDESYFIFYNKKADRLICPNELYVAVTRASEILILIHDKNQEYLPFLNKSEIDTNCLKIGQKDTVLSLNNPYKCKTSVTELVRHLPCEIVEQALTYLEIEEVKKEEEFIDVPVVVKQREIFYEDVSDINGVAIPALFELQNSDNHSQKNIITRTEIFQKRSTNVGKNIEIPELLKRANYWNSFTSGYKFKLSQISDYNWLNSNNLGKCMERLKKLIAKTADFEVEIKLLGEKEILFRELKGFIDCWDGCDVWEFKCVRRLTDEHKLQLAVYMYLFETNLHIHKKKAICKRRRLENNQKNWKYGKWIIETHKKMNYFLFNILNNNMLKISSDLKRLKEMIGLMFEYKYGDKKVENTEEFIERNYKLNSYKK